MYICMASIQYKSDWCCVCPALLLLLLGQVQLTPTPTPTRRWLSWRLALWKLNPNPFASLSISSRLFARFFRLLCRTSFSSSFKSLAKFFIVFQHRLFSVPFMSLYAARSWSCSCCRCSCCGNCIWLSNTGEASLYTSLCWCVCVHNLVPIAAKVICSAFSRQLSLGSVSLRPIARSGFSVKRVQIKFEETPLTISAILKPNNSRF